MKRIICLALFCIIIALVGCGDPAVSQTSTESNAVSRLDNSTENSSEVSLQSNADLSNGDLNESSDISESSSYSCPEQSCESSETVEEDNTTDIESEIEINFSEFE